VEYIKVSEAAARWGISSRRVRILCAEGRIDGVIRKGNLYMVPAEAPRPSDGRSRRTTDEGDLFQHLTDNTNPTETEGSTKVPQRTTRLKNGGSNRTEVAHDVFYKLMSALKQEREKRKRMTIYFTVGATFVTGIGLTLLLRSLLKQNKR